LSGKAQTFATDKVCFSLGVAEMPQGTIKKL